MISYIRGYYVITVEGVGTERFLNYLIRNNINVYNVNRISNTKIQFCVDRKDISDFKKAYRGSNFQIKVKQKTGIPFVLKRIYKYKGMWICAIISLTILMTTSQFVTDIYIDCPEGIKQEEVRTEIYKLGLKPGIYKKNIDRKKIRDSIMVTFEDVAYISLNVKGTNVFVTITKKAETLSSKEESNYCNIIAEKNGIIEKVIPRSGNSVVAEGDIVQSGDLLVSGSNTKSLPEVWATTFYEVKKSASYIENKKEKTGKSKNVYTISFYDKIFNIRKNIKYKDYIIENKELKLKIGNYTFPIKIKVSTFYEVETTKIEKDENELKKELKEQALKELDYIIPASAKYTDVKDKYKINKNVLEYIVTVYTSENIAKVYPLSKSEAEQLIIDENKSKEESGEVVPSDPSRRLINDIRNEIQEGNDESDENENSNN
ncbi:sporulation protein YqfD [Romboutsia sp. Marseille-P6047]|uniref:sporulation protein YqfD n=1 Tax=Romboutsia sp. Marseille-P6047 TaxID=2161817 RepID=UPI000F04C565|nr:sporulation protein YqfD [Romboutsia sp. Marseille-P6047]